MIRSVRLILWVFVACAAFTARAAAQQRVAEPALQVVQVDGRAMRVQSSGLNSRASGRPIILFEAGATQSLETWRNVVPQLVGIAPLVAYDRSGLGESVWDEQSPTPQHVTGKLRRLLREIGADPPYVLVGHSWGGSLVRFFAGYYPDEVAGIVYVDPGPIVTQSFDDELAPFEAIGAGRTAYEAFWSGYERALTRASPAVSAEFGVYRRLMQLDTAERDLRPQPDVPVVVILAAKPYPPLPGLPFDPEKHFRSDLSHRMERLKEWALATSHGTVVVTNHSSHAVPSEDPGLISWAVKRVLDAIGK